MRAVLVVALAAATVGFAADRHHRQFDPMDMAGRGAITGASALSFTTPARLEQALGAAEAEAPRGATILLLEVAPTEISGTLVSSEGQNLFMEVDASLKAVVRETNSGSDDTGITFGAVPTEAPSRILRNAATRLGLKPSALESMTMSRSGLDAKPSAWSISYTRPFTKNKAIAAFDGTDVRRPDQPAAAARAELRAMERRAAEAQRALAGAPR